MPAVSKSQQRLMGQAYAVKKGKIDINDIDPDYRDKIRKLVKGMTKKQLRDFASTPYKNKNGESLPEVKEQFRIQSILKFLYENKMAKCVKVKLNLAGIFEDEDGEINGYIKAIANTVIEKTNKFSKKDDPEFSANMVREIFDSLCDWQIINPITSDLNEWIDVCEINKDGSKKLWQNKINPVIFSKDAGKTWFKIDESILGYVEACLESIILNPGMNLIGMGPIEFPDNPGTNTDFYSQNTGSGDIPARFLFSFDKNKDKDLKKKKFKKLKLKKS